MFIIKSYQTCRNNLLDSGKLCLRTYAHASAFPQEPEHPREDREAQRNIHATEENLVRKKYASKIQIDSIPPTKILSDWIGPPNRHSHIRPTIFHIPENETALEKEFRLKREEFFHFNHDFWSKHNHNFTKQKAAFIAERLSQMEEPRPTKLSAEELSEFYRIFLDGNRIIHQKYNRELYNKNIALLWPALKVQLEQLFVTRRNATKK